MRGILSKVISGIISASMIIGTAAIPAVNAADDGLLFHLTFDETNADKTSFEATKGGTVTKKGSCVLAPSIDEENGNALNISANAAGNYIELPKGILNGKEAATVSFWIKPESGWPFMITPVSGAQEYLNEKYLGMLATSSALTVERYNNSGTRLSSVITNGTYTDWQYITVIFEANGTKVYINGTLAGSDTAAVDIKSLMTADASAWIGHGNWGGGEGFSGTIDDFRIYGKALTEDEVKTLAEKSIQREQEKIIKEKNCLEIDTQFYDKDGNKIFRLKAGEKATVKTTVTNYTMNVHSVCFDIFAYDSKGNKLSNKASAPVELATMESREFTEEITAQNNAAYYRVNLKDASGKSANYDAGYLPIADVSFPAATAPDSASTTEGIHDPTIFKDPVSKKYYAYSSHNLVFESSDLINWQKHDYTQKVTVPVKAKAFIDANYSNTAANGTYWAPDLYYKKGDEYPYWFYLSTSCGLGGRNSVISLIKAKSPGLWDGEYVDAGVVIASKENSNYHTNAIDANIFTDTDGKTYFIWGSFWKGIHMAELDTDTGFVKGVDYTSDATILSSCEKFGTRVYSTPSGVQGPEGAYTVYNKDTGYRYMFTSYGWLGTNYNIRVARTNKTFAEIISGKDPHKQLLDQKSRPVGATYTDQIKEGGTLSELWGYKMSGSFQLGDGIEYVGSGHNSVFQDDDGQWYLVQHCRKVADAIAYLQVKKILWTEDGWPVISPMVYAGEKEQKIPKEMLYGTWDLSSVGHTILKDGITDVSNRNSEKNADLPVHSSQIILEADGSIGNGIGTWEYDNDHTVTLKFDTDGNTDNYEFYHAGDIMKLFVLTGYDKDKRESALVMTGTDQNGTASFAKKANAAAQSTKNINIIKTTPVVIEKSNTGNPILGFDGNGNRMYAGDPAAMVDGDTVYIYAGHDTSTADNYVMPEWVCYSSKNMTDWKYEGPVMKATDVSWKNDNNSAWASQAIKYRDKYYLYFCTWDKTSGGKQSIGVAVADSPKGPFKDTGAPLVKGTLTEPQTSDWNDIDPTVWVETVDGVEHRYLAWGNGIFYVCELNEDMVSVKDLNSDGQIKMNDDIKQQEFKNLPDGLGFTEAPFIYRRQDENGNYTGKYYLFGAFGWREQMGYATSDSMYGSWEWGGILMPPTATSNTNHPSVIDFNGSTYFIYHNGSLPYGNGFRRSICAEKLYFNEDGSINPIQETSIGLTGKAVYIGSGIDENGIKVIAHEKFVNPSDDASYPIKKQLTEELYKEKSDEKDIIPTALWQIKSGKADSSNENYISIESYDKSGLYITADGSNVILTQQDTLDEALARKMTFVTVKGINGKSDMVSFESAAKKGQFLTLTSDGVTLTDGSDTDACSFNIISGLSNLDEPEPPEIVRGTNKITIKSPDIMFQYALYNSAGELVHDWVSSAYDTDIVFDNLSKNTEYEIRIREKGNPDNIYSETVKTRSSGSSGSSSKATPKPSATPAASPKPAETSSPISELDKENHIQFIYGKEDGNFDLNGSVTRAEILAMFARLYKDFDMNKSYQSSFSDVRTNAWYANTIGFMADKNIVSGYEDNTFRPENTITRAEFAVIAAKFTGVSGGDTELKDVSDNHWAAKAIPAVVSSGAMSAPDGHFNPDANLTRADAVKAICQITDRIIDSSSLQNVSDYNTFPDVTEDSDYYYYIVEAANSHSYTRDTDEVWTEIK